MTSHALDPLPLSQTVTLFQNPSPQEHDVLYGQPLFTLANAGMENANALFSHANVDEVLYALCLSIKGETDVNWHPALLPTLVKLLTRSSVHANRDPRAATSFGPLKLYGPNHILRMQTGEGAEHVLRKIHDCTFRPKDFLPDFFDLNSPGNFCRQH